MPTMKPWMKMRRSVFFIVSVSSGRLTWVLASPADYRTAAFAHIWKADPESRWRRRRYDLRL